MDHKNKITREVKIFLEEMNVPMEKLQILVGLSGGRDSMALFSVLFELKKSMGFSLAAVHVDHLIREESEEDAAFVKAFCEEKEVPVVIRKVDIPAIAKEKNKSLEEAARDERHRILREEREKWEAQGYSCFIALAHHQNDQAETVMINLLRGAGLRGLSGMSKVRGFLIRPLLNISREEIDRFVSENQIPYREDKTNQDTLYVRNRIRHELLEEMKTYNPGIVASLADMAERFREDEEVLKELGEKVYHEALTCRGDLKIEKVKGESAAIRKRVLSRFLEDKGVRRNVSRVHLDQADKLLFSASGKSLDLPGSLTLKRSYDILTINCFCGEVLPDDERKSLFGEDFGMEILKEKDAFQGEIPDLTYEKWMKADGMTKRPIFRERRDGDYLLILKEDKKTLGKKKLKDVLMDAKVPREERDLLPVLAEGSFIWWVPGIRMSDSVKIDKDTEKILHVFKKDGV